MKLKLLFALLTLPFTSFGQVAPVGSSTASAPPNISYTTDLTVFNNEVYFPGDFINGVEILKIDASDNLIYQFSDINPGFNNSNPNDFYVHPNTNEMYFKAIGYTSGSATSATHELWKTDGTVAGTVIAADFNSFMSSFPEDITGINDKILMRVTDNNVGIELGVYNITNDNNFIIDINTGGSGFSSEPSNFFEFDGYVYFSAFDSFFKRELFRTNGTNAGTQFVKDINTNTASVGSSDPDNFTIFNNKLYFTAKDGFNGNELWVTDGTNAGTVMVADINPGLNASNPENLTVFGNRLYFSATTDTGGTEIYYMFANESIVLHRDINSGTGSSNPSNFFVYNGNLYFSADDGVNGEELWRTDGSIFGVSMFKDINPSSSSSPRFPIEYNNKLYFVADDGTTGRELWTTDGTNAGTMLVADINSSGSSEPISFIVANDILYFHADNGTARRIWNYQDPALSVSNIELSTTKLYPNPANKSFSIESNSNIDSIEIFNALGKNVLQFKNELSNYDVSSLTSGLYFVKIKSEGIEVTKKLIKQ